MAFTCHSAAVSNTSLSLSTFLPPYVSPPSLFTFLGVSLEGSTSQFMLCLILRFPSVADIDLSCLSRCSCLNLAPTMVYVSLLSAFSLRGLYNRIWEASFRVDFRNHVLHQPMHNLNRSDYEKRNRFGTFQIMSDIIIVLLVNPGMSCTT